MLKEYLSRVGGNNSFRLNIFYLREKARSKHYHSLVYVA